MELTYHVGTRHWNPGLLLEHQEPSTTTKSPFLSSRDEEARSKAVMGREATGTPTGQERERLGNLDSIMYGVGLVLLLSFFAMST